LLTNSTEFSAWENLVSEVERESRSCTQLSQKLVTSVSQQLSDLTARKKNLIKKVKVTVSVSMAILTISAGG